MLVDALVHEETDRPVGRSNQQRYIHKRHVVAHEQCAGLVRKVVAPDYLDEINSVRDEKENQPPKPFRQQDEHIDRSRRGNEGSCDNHATRIEMYVFREDVVNARRQRDPDEREQVGSGNDSALVFLSWAMLNERIHRHGIEAGPEAECAQEQCRTQQAMRRNAEQEARNRHSD